MTSNKISFQLNIPGEFLFDKRPDAFIEVDAERYESGLIRADVAIMPEIGDNMSATILTQVLKIALRRAQKLFDDIAPGDHCVTPDGIIIYSPQISKKC